MFKVTQILVTLSFLNIACSNEAPKFSETKQNKTSFSLSSAGTLDSEAKESKKDANAVATAVSKSVDHHGDTNSTGSTSNKSPFDELLGDFSNDNNQDNSLDTMPTVAQDTQSENNTEAEMSQTNTNSSVGALEGDGPSAVEEGSSDSVVPMDGDTANSNGGAPSGSQRSSPPDSADDSGEESSASKAESSESGNGEESLLESNEGDSNNKHASDEDSDGKDDGYDAKSSHSYGGHCAKIFGVSRKLVIFPDHKGSPVGKLLVARIAGKGHEVEIKLLNDIPSAAMLGVCIIVTGSSNVVAITSQFLTGAVVGVMGGNKNKLTFTEDGKELFMRGLFGLTGNKNRASVELNSDDSARCKNNMLAKIKGNSSEFSCQ